MVRRRAVRPVRALSWWVVAAAGVVVAGVVWGATAWLLAEAGRAQDPAAARVEAVKTGLGIGAGTGGLFALLLAVRRQWHQELSTAATDHDATERRVTELYTRAVEQLGSAQAPVRLGGLYALERVAQDNPGQRQTVVNVLCAYLRMPYTPPGSSPRRLGIRPRPTRDAQRNPTSAVREELEVRLTAQRILEKHLYLGSEPATPVDTFWADMELDLTGATLMGWNLRRCRVHDATFDRAEFIGETIFRGVRFTGSASFNQAHFTGDAWFDGSEFDGTAYYDQTDFLGAARFEDALFYAEAFFGRTRFAGDAWFDRTQFARLFSFNHARIGGAARFEDVQFAPDTDNAGFLFVVFEQGVPVEIAALPEPIRYEDDWEEPAG